MNLHIRMALANDRGEEFCGPGILELLDGVQRTGSIRQAAQSMELSYVKALKILNRVEREMGESLLIRHRGGENRGGAELTPFAACFLQEFVSLRRDVQRQARPRYARFIKRISHARKTP